MAKILIVHNDSMLPRALGRSLALHGHEHIPAASIQGATAQFEAAGDIDIVLASLQLAANGNGVDLHRILTLHFKFPPERFILMSSNAGHEVTEYIRQHGSNLLVKPFDLEDLEDLIANILAN